jgi:probable F420-dependent oxidoreductase
VDADQALARAIGRDRVRNPYLGLVNYTSNLRRMGWSEDDLADGGSDALVDALAVHGSADEVATRLRAHLEAGADHVAIQLLTEEGADPVPGYRTLAGALKL